MTMRMAEFLKAPLDSFYSAKFYKKLPDITIGRGLFYLLYLAIILAIAITISASFIYIPMADNFVAWLQQEFPPIVLTQEGVVTNATQPYYANHPTIGTVFVVDSTRETVSDADLEEAFAFIGKTELVYWDPFARERRTFSLLPPEEAIRQGAASPTITGEVLAQYYRQAVPLLAFVLICFSFIMCVLVEIFTVLIFSLAGLFANTYRQGKLSYEQIFNVSCFAVTPVMLVHWINYSYFDMSGGVFMMVFFVFLVGYSYLAFIAPEKQAEKPSPS